MAMKTPAADTAEPRPSRNREQTAAALQTAISRLQGQGRRPTISAVAGEAGVSSALIHNRYPEIAQALRALYDPKEKATRHDSALEAERQKGQSLRAELDELRHQVRALASVNEALRRELLLQTAVAGGKVVPICGSQGEE